jgi:penicillin G amidase
MKRFIKRLIVVLVLVALAAGGGYLWWYLRNSLLPLDGQLQLSGLRAPVEIRFDDHSVPSVYARDVDDAWYAAGLLHARERRWQMELYRRVTLGRLSEILGSSTIPIDQRFLTLGLRDAAKAEWERATPAVKLALERYCEGVNDGMKQLVGRFAPLEFQMLGLTPTPWEPVDSLAVGRLLIWRLAENHQAELIRAALGAKFDEATARELTGIYPKSAPAILDPTGPRKDAGASTQSASFTPVEYPRGLEWLAPGARRGNSNNWVIAGNRTKGGRPILANDPHLQIEFPSTWYEMHLVAAGLDVIGVTIPGVPFIALGHNQRIAWGMTATNADVEDLTLERIDVEKKQAMYRGQWVPVQIRQTEIPVRGRRTALPFEVWKTRNGSIFADSDLDFDAPPAWLSPDDRGPEEQRAYSIRWDADGDLAAAFEAMNRAGDWTSFTAAVDLMSSPSMNIVYADVDGNIGYAMSGKLPVRSGSDGTFPGNDSTPPSWTGSIGASALPRVYNPPSGVIFSANNEIDRGFSGMISKDWAAPFRATRLRDQLSKAQGVDLDSSAALQNDRHSIAADLVLAGLDGAIKAGRGNEKEAPAVRLLEKLQGWDHVVDARPVVSLYEAFEHALWRRTFEDEMESALFLKFYEWAGAEKPAGLYSIINDRQNKWWDDITTIEKKETRDDIFLIAIRDADDTLGGSDKPWDRLHGARFSHPLGNIAFPFRWFFSKGPIPVEGDGTTLMRISWNRLKPFEAWEHPSWRQIFDVGEWDQSRVAMPTGQSGHPMSLYYFDQNDIWRTGQYRTQLFTRNAVAGTTRHRLYLVP